MIDIKIRSWHKESGQMIYFHETLEQFIKNAIKTTKSLTEESKIMKCIGLKDMKGRDIYEGDIIEFRPWGEESENYVVKYIVEDASYRGIKEDKSGTKVISLINADKGLKVIGNIFENPELIKEANDERD